MVLEGRFRDLRILMRTLKLGALITALNYVVEGLFELDMVYAQFVYPPSVPGQAKIIEHFLIQHALFPLILLLLVFRPVALIAFFRSIISRYFLAILALLIFIPEIVVSFGYGDLFNPYPFDLSSRILKSVEMIQFAGKSINLLQLEHLLFCHLLLTSIFVGLALSPSCLKAFAGPRTNKGDFL
jgi:hypothetical protein